MAPRGRNASEIDILPYMEFLDLLWDKAFTGLPSPICFKNLIVSAHREPKMQGVERANVLSYFKCLADAVPGDRLQELFCFVAEAAAPGLQMIRL
jgi:hypothetical protein